MPAAGSLRALAGELGVTQRTVVRWRRTVLAAMAQEPTQLLGGVVEIKPFRPAAARHLQLMCGVDGDGMAVIMVMAPWPYRADVAQTLHRFVAPDALLTMSAFSARGIRRSAEAAGFRVHVAEAARAQAHVRTLNRWLRRFRGARHMRDYIAWFNAVHRTVEPPLAVTTRLPDLRGDRSTIAPVTPPAAHGGGRSTIAPVAPPAAHCGGRSTIAPVAPPAAHGGGRSTIAPVAPPAADRQQRRGADLTDSRRDG